MNTINLQNLILYFLLIAFLASPFVGKGIGGSGETAWIGALIMLLGAIGVIAYSVKPKRKPKDKREDSD